jgi:hypothetical protein
MSLDLLVNFRELVLVQENRRWGKLAQKACKIDSYLL